MFSSGDSVDDRSIEKQDLMDDREFKKEMREVFIKEFEELMGIYRTALREIRKPYGNLKHAYQEIFRVYHTLKGDSAFFEEFEDFANYSKILCDQFRNLPDDQLSNPSLLKCARMNFIQLSSAYSALHRGRSLQALRFSIISLDL